MAKPSIRRHRISSTAAAAGIPLHFFAEPILVHLSSPITHRPTLDDSFFQVQLSPVPFRLPTADRHRSFIPHFTSARSRPLPLLLPLAGVLGCGLMWPGKELRPQFPVTTVGAADLSYIKFFTSDFSLPLPTFPF
jgi:hypothetical protein